MTTIDKILTAAGVLMEDTQYAVGDDIEIMSNGKAYQAKVRLVRPDGSIEPSFPINAKPSDAKPSYGKNEIASKKKPAVGQQIPATKPAVPPQAASAPRAPGIG